VFGFRQERPSRAGRVAVLGVMHQLADLVYIALTVALFVVLALVLKGVERL
jgi:hypothetical protein